MPLNACDLRQSQLRQMPRKIQVLVQISKELELVGLFAACSLISQRELFLDLCSLANDGNVPLETVSFSSLLSKALSSQLG
jgi:hypothetical protein